MQIAVAVKDELLTLAPNAGHALYFAVFNVGKLGPWAHAELIELRPNPRMVGEDPDHQCQGEETGTCQHTPEEEILMAPKRKEMAQSLADCRILLARKACKNSVEAFKNAGVSVIGIDGKESAQESAVNFIYRMI